MTFDEWWKVMKPAECDELKEYFVEAYLAGYQQGTHLENAGCVMTCKRIQEMHSEKAEALRYDYETRKFRQAESCGAEDCVEALQARHK